MRQQQIEKKLDFYFSPHHLQVINESYKHNVPEGSESHFKVIIVSDKFCGLRLVARHRLVNEALSDEFGDGLHALSMHTLTKEEWKQQTFPSSPDCMGGGH
ncbi:BolA family protein [Vibrio ezurae]|uniref:DNA-binding transcriptional regulator BolA n=1 Tax=Vibrio ezurae NBRC 102218 TaxID=1219080 RepID=U3CIP1_9VIBR|nr:BolA/IbaG family iron-sulfur metabolism protein [Vibrio ezurae]GAD81034.1 BolA protein [Vibrio ezurae NBRC 102218]